MGFLEFLESFRQLKKNYFSIRILEKKWRYKNNYLELKIKKINQKKKNLIIIRFQENFKQAQ